MELGGAQTDTPTGGALPNAPRCSLGIREPEGGMGPRESPARRGQRALAGWPVERPVGQSERTPRIGPSGRQVGRLLALVPKAAQPPSLGACDAAPNYAAAVRVPFPASGPPLTVPLFRSAFCLYEIIARCSFLKLWVRDQSFHSPWSFL